MRTASPVLSKLMHNKLIKLSSYSEAICNSVLLCHFNNSSLSFSDHNESISRSEWRRLLVDYQNISESFLAAAKANTDLRGDNDVLKQRSVWLEQQTQLLNKTSAKLLSVNLALRSESTNLMERILNLTSTNSQLVQENERLVQHTSEQEEERLNTSQTIRHLLDSNTRREEERRRLAEMSRLLKDELSQLQEKNQELLGINNGFQGEIKNLSEQVGALLDCEETSAHNTQLQQKVTELQVQNQNLSSVLLKERQEAAGQVEQTAANMHSMKEACSSLDLYCPVVNFKTKGTQNADQREVSCHHTEGPSIYLCFSERVCRKCPESWQLFDNKCYYFSSRMLTWSSSRAWCQTQGGDLLIVDSEPEQVKNRWMDSQRIGVQARCHLNLSAL